MSYQDPYYADHHVAGASSQHQDNQPHGVGASQEYYNPYNPNGKQYTDQRQPDDHQPDHSMPQNQAVYNNYPPPQRKPTSSSRKSKPSRFPQTLREYRYDHQGNLCTKGGRVRCFGRICCCSFMTTVFLFVSIVLTLGLWLRPPNITIGSVQTVSGSTGSAIQTTNDGLTVDLGVVISVTNPNYFSVSLKAIDAEIFYPINNTPVGGGSATNILFHSHSKTDFTFPFSLSYNTTEDPQGTILTDLATKCGALGGSKSNLNIDYKITLGIRILMVTISPVISNQFNFPCPISASDISKFLSGKT